MNLVAGFYASAGACFSVAIYIFGFKVFRYAVALLSAIASGALAALLLGFGSKSWDVAFFAFVCGCIGGGFLAHRYQQQMAAAMMGLVWGAMALAVLTFGTRMGDSAFLVALMVAIIASVLTVRFYDYVAAAWMVSFAGATLTLVPEQPSFWSALRRIQSNDPLALLRSVERLIEGIFRSVVADILLIVVSFFIAIWLRWHCWQTRQSTAGVRLRPELKPALWALGWMVVGSATLRGLFPGYAALLAPDGVLLLPFMLIAYERFVLPDSTRAKEQSPSLSETRRWPAFAAAALFGAPLAATMCFILLTLDRSKFDLLLNYYETLFDFSNRSSTNNALSRLAFALLGAPLLLEWARRNSRVKALQTPDGSGVFTGAPAIIEPDAAPIVVPSGASSEGKSAVAAEVAQRRQAPAAAPPETPEVFASSGDGVRDTPNAAGARARPDAEAVHARSVIGSSRSSTRLVVGLVGLGLLVGLAMLARSQSPKSGDPDSENSAEPAAQSGAGTPTESAEGEATDVATAVSEPVVTRVAPSNQPPSVAAGVATSVGPEGMVLVPAGAFTMGSEQGKGSEIPSRTVTLTKAFFIDKTEVTSGAYGECVASGTCTPTSIHGPAATEQSIREQSAVCTGGDPARATHPINCIDRAQADAYCRFTRKRLPTEAEWEYAARGASTRTFPWGDDAPVGCQLAVTAGCTKRLSDVGSRPRGASPFGALDMAGNVWEWVSDGWTDRTTLGAIDPVAAPGKFLGVLRGGSWDFSAPYSRAFSRLKFTVASGHVSTGVRCARDAGE